MKQCVNNRILIILLLLLYQVKCHCRKKKCFLLFKNSIALYHFRQGAAGARGWTRVNLARDVYTVLTLAVMICLMADGKTTVQQQSVHFVVFPDAKSHLTSIQSQVSMQMKTFISRQKHLKS